MYFAELTESDKKEYNRFIAANPGGSFLQAWEWGEWQVRLGLTVSRFKITDESGKQIGAVQFVRMPLFGKYYYLYAPYGPVFAGGESVKYQISNIKKGLQELHKKHPNALFVRIEPQVKIEGLEQIAKKSTNIQPGITMVVDLKKTDGQLLAGMHHKTRYNIKVAQRHEVEVQSELMVTPGHGLYLKEAIEAILQTQTRQKYRGHTKGYYYGLLDFFALYNSTGAIQVRVYKAIYKQQLLASGIMVDFGHIRMYLYGGSSDELKNIMAPYVLHFEAMKDARELGMTEYDLGGSEVASGGERGFTRFKQGFGGRVIEYAGAYDIIFSKPWYTIYRVFRTANRWWKN